MEFINNIENVIKYYEKEENFIIDKKLLIKLQEYINKNFNGKDIKNLTINEYLQIIEQYKHNYFISLVILDMKFYDWFSDIQNKTLHIYKFINILRLLKNVYGNDNFIFNESILINNNGEFNNFSLSIENCNLIIEWNIDNGWNISEINFNNYKSKKILETSDYIKVSKFIKNKIKN